MTNQESETSTNLGIGPLIELFYSLAIVSGIEDAVNLLLDPAVTNKFIILLATIAALLLSLGDWAVFHIYVSPHKYHRIIRVIMDLLIVISLFCVFRGVNFQAFYIAASTIYFILGSSYHLLLRAEHLSSIPITADKIAIFQLFLATIAVTSLAEIFFTNTNSLWFYVIIGTNMCWGIVNLKAADNALRKTK